MLHAHWSSFLEGYEAWLNDPGTHTEAKIEYLAGLALFSLDAASLSSRCREYDIGIFGEPGELADERRQLLANRIAESFGFGES